MSEFKKKLIEVALPLEAINKESAREKSIRHGHPSTLHLWWARRPLATCRAVIFASLVDDPSAHPEKFPGEEAQEAERQRLFRIIEELVKWDNSTNETVLAAARAEIMRSTDGDPPPFLDPFCGGGSIPLEAQRLGLEAHASDLNPVALLITKALIEIPPKFAGLPPVNPESRIQRGAFDWSRAEGLAEDVRHYGRWMREEAERRVGHLYPKVGLPNEHGGGDATVIAWLWARTVRCPNPACGAEMPLVRSFALSTKSGRQARVVPVVDAEAKTVSFEMKTGAGVVEEGTKQRGRSRCLFCGKDNISDADLRHQSLAHGLGAQLMAVVADGPHGRIYVAPDGLDERVSAEPSDTTWLEQALPENPRWFSPPGYGLGEYRDLFTDRQLVVLTTLSDLVAEARRRVLRDATAAWTNLSETSSVEATASTYADAVATFLAFGVDKAATTNSALATWQTYPPRLTQVFSRQALPMAWDFAEANPFSGAAGDYYLAAGSLAEVIERLPCGTVGTVLQRDAASGVPECGRAPLISTDPPYYDNIGYADLSDYYYVWLRRCLRDVYPEIVSTLLVPKRQELVANPYRFGGDRSKAEAFFEDGLEKAFKHVRDRAGAYPITVYYAFKQAESTDEGLGMSVASTGWEKMLTGLLDTGLSIVGTWPMRTELTTSLKKGIGALASSVVLVCRPRLISAPLATRQEFLGALRAELPEALKTLQHGNVAPVDLAQASIGPGMAVFSRYSKVMETDGSQMSVRTALALINQALDEILSEQEGEFDADTRWAIVWFEQYGFEPGPFGDADNMCRAKNTSVQGMVEAGASEAKGGKVRLLRRDELEEDWDPATDRRLTVWEMTQQLIRRLDEGEAAASALARRLGANAQVARDLAYRLYLVCERKKWAQDALAYNALVVAWPQIQRLAAAESALGGLPQTSFEV